MQINIYKDKLLGARLFGASVLYSTQPIRHMLCPASSEDAGLFYAYETSA